jgi:hypothetical protein
MKTKTIFIVIVAIGTVLFGEQIRIQECVGQIDEVIINGRLETALTLTQQCIESETSSSRNTSAQRTGHEASRDQHWRSSP